MTRQLRIAGLSGLFLLSSLAMVHSVRAQSTPLDPAASQRYSSRMPPESTDNELIVAYWTTETGWKSELQLRNNLAGQDLVVTPVMRLAGDGADTALAPVTIKPQEVASIDLESAIGKTAPQLIGTYGSLVLRYHSLGHSNLYSALMVRRTGHPFAFHIDAMAEEQDYEAGAREGVWWLPKETTTGYLILTNQGRYTLSLDLSLYDANGNEHKQKVVLGSRETSRLSVRKLLVGAGITGSYGGIKVSAASHEGSLDTLHLLYDETAEFSAILKMFDHDPRTKLEERDFAKTSTWTSRAPMLALANPDPALAFPPGTILRPQLFVRNATGKVIDASLRFNWRDGSSTGSAPGPAMRLSPFETRRVDVAALQNQGALPKQGNWASVILTTNSLPDEVMAVAASFDETMRYGAQTPFSDQLSFKWEGGMWEYDPTHSSIMTAGNGGTKSMQAAFTIFYNQGAEKYELEQTLKPDEQMWMDVGKLIREKVPDKTGKVLPSDLTSGSYEFRDLTDRGVGSLFEGKVIYDKTYGHAAYGCAMCCGYRLPLLDWNPLGIPFGFFNSNFVLARDWCAGSLADITEDFWGNWSTANTGIATVDYYGSHYGANIGSTTTNTYGYYPYATLNRCPMVEAFPNGGTNVNDFTLSSAQNIMDGQQGAFSVSVTGGTATGYQWSFAAPTGAGNGPSVNFTAATSAQTNTDGHWFALPNVACPTSSQIPAYYNAAYTIEAAVTFSDNSSETKATSLTVNSYWNPAGITDPNIARIGGLPQMASDGPDGTGTWRVTGQGTLSRVVPTAATIYVIPTSQFYNKTVQHEQVHVNNWILGAGHLYGDLYIVVDFYNQIVNITGTSQNDLINNLGNALTSYVNSQSVLVGQRYAQDEHQAYLVSDPIAPQYVYQNCGRF